MITNEWVPGTGDISEALRLRRKVFVDEQHVPENEEADEDDAKALHLLIRDGETAVAAGRIWHDGRTFRLGRCCVLKEERGRGIGDLLVKLLLLKVFEYNPSEVRIHAQSSKEHFYARYGFRRDGEEFEECGIRHVPMSVGKETVTFPSACGNDKHFEDFFEEADGQ